jgi:hypothetical protein
LKIVVYQPFQKVYTARTPDSNYDSLGPTPLVPRVFIGGSAAGVNWRGRWDVNASYSINDAISYNWQSFYALTPNTGMPPDQHPATWEQLLFEAIGTGITVQPSLYEVAKVLRGSSEGTGYGISLLSGQYTPAP